MFELSTLCARALTEKGSTTSSLKSFSIFFCPIVPRAWTSSSRMSSFAAPVRTAVRVVLVVATLEASLRFTRDEEDVFF